MHTAAIYDRLPSFQILAHPKFKAAKRISLFLSMPNEVPTEPLLQDIISRGDAAFVPQYSKGKMRMLRLLPGDQDVMVETSWKIKQHAKDAEREDAMENGKTNLEINSKILFLLQKKI